MEESEYQKLLYIALWYLDRGTDFSPTTRRDMIEVIIEGLNKKNLLQGESHQRGIELVKKEYEGHPLQEKVIECLESFTSHED